MQVDAVTSPGSALLHALRGVLTSSDDALLCVAFAQARGVHLIAKEVTELARRGRARVLVTNVFGATSDVALDALREAGASVRVLNPGGSTYHPKVFLGRSGDRVAAMVGSSNLTSGLVANIEAATLLRGTSSEHPIAALWSWGESLWADSRGVDYTGWSAHPGGCARERVQRADGSTWSGWADVRYTASPTERDEEIEPELLAALAAVASDSPVVYTLGSSPRPNRIAEVTPSGIWVETERTLTRDSGAQVVAPRMLNLAWDVLRMSNRTPRRLLR